MLLLALEDLVEVSGILSRVCLAARCKCLRESTCGLMLVIRTSSRLDFLLSATFCHDQFIATSLLIGIQT